MKRRIALWAWMFLVGLAVPGVALAQGGAAGTATPASAPASSSGGGATAAPATDPATPTATAPAATTPAAGTAAPASGPTAGQPAAMPAGKMPQDQFELKVKDLEEKVTDLKEKIYRTKARLLLLQETVIGGGDLSSAKAVLVHENKMGASFVLQSVAYALDGAPIFTRVNTDGSLDKQAQMFNGRIVPGNHQLTVQMKFRGNGFGVFSYLNGYKFNLQSSYTFNAEGGKVTTVKAVAFEKGGFTTDIKDRPAIRFEEQVVREQVHHGEPSAQAPPPGGPAAAKTPAAGGGAAASGSH
jgi:hypothetical protein